VECPDYLCDKLHEVSNRGCWVLIYDVLGLLSESSYHAPSVKGAIFLLCMLYWIVVSWLLGPLCRVGCRHLHVPQNSRQPWDLKWLKAMGTWAWVLIMCLGGPNLVGSDGRVVRFTFVAKWMHCAPLLMVVFVVVSRWGLQSSCAELRSWVLLLSSGVVQFSMLLLLHARTNL